MGQVAETMKVMDASEDAIRATGHLAPSEAGVALAIALGRVCAVPGGLGLPEAVRLARTSYAASGR